MLSGVAADPHHCSGARDARDGRADGEHKPAEAERAHGAEQVRKAAAEQQQATEGDDVGVEDPREGVG